AGVDAFHEEISSLKPKPVENQGDVQVPLVTPPAGNWKAWKPTLYCCAADVGAARTSASASAASVPRITGRLYTRSRIERRCALRGRHRGDCCATVFYRVGSKDRGRRPEALHRAVDAEGQFPQAFGDRRDALQGSAFVRDAEEDEGARQDDE